MSRADIALSANATRKLSFRTRLTSLLSQYEVFLLIKADNVGSKQLQEIRKSLRGKAEILMGKNTMILNVMRQFVDRYPGLAYIMPHIKGKTGMVFTHADIREVKSMLLAKKVQRAAKAGSVAPVNVVIPAGNTNLEPTKTSFFQALSIPSKINKGTIAIENNVHLIKAGEKVTHSQAALLQMLNIKPFQFGLSVGMVYDHGDVFSLAHEDCATQGDAFLSLIQRGILNVAALASALGDEANGAVLASMQASFPSLFGLTSQKPSQPTVTETDKDGDASPAQGEDDDLFALFDDGDEADDGDDDNADAVGLSSGNGVVNLFGADEDEVEGVEEMGCLFGEEDEEDI